MLAIDSPWTNFNIDIYSLKQSASKNFGTGTKEPVFAEYSQ